jgi:hypothetical protein
LAKKPQTAKPEEKIVLVPVEKDGETIRVHTSQVEQHQRLGWKVKE